MELMWFHLMPYTEEPKDFRDKRRHLRRAMRRHSAISWSRFVEMGGAYSSGIRAFRRPRK